MKVNGSRIGVLSLAGLLAATAGSAVSADTCEMVKLLAPGGAADDEFGEAVSIDGGVAVVGVPEDGDACVGCGSAYAYRWSGSAWVEEAHLFGWDVSQYDEFGGAVAVSGDVIVIGARFDDEAGQHAGAAYGFRWNGSTWAQDGKLVPSDATGDEFFGCAVALDADVALIGAYDDDDNGDESGSAYIYRWNGSSWFEQAKLTASDGAAGDILGYSVAVDGDVAVLGAKYHSSAAFNAGAAYVYRWNGSSWLEEAKLVASDAAELDNFGECVAVHGDMAFIGVPGDDDNGDMSGSVRVFRFNGSSWTEEATLLASDGAAGDFFGITAAIQGDVAVIGAGAADGVGAVYVFAWNGLSWVEQDKISASDGTADDYFGASLGLDGEVIVVGAMGDDVNGADSGSAYIIGGVASDDCNGNTLADTCEILAGTATDYNANLVPDGCSSELFVYNLTADTMHGTIAEAIDQAASGDELVATELAFDLEPDIDFNDKAITLRSLAAIEQVAGGLIVLADGARLETAITGSTFTVFNGELRVEAGDAADVESDYIDFNDVGQVTCRASSRLDVSALASWLWGITRVHEQATLAFNGGPVRADGGTTVSPGGAFLANGGMLTTGPVIVNHAELDVHESLELDMNGAITAVVSNVFITGTCDNAGTLNLLDSLMIGGPIDTGGLFDLTGSTVYADGITVDAGGRMNTSGEIHSDVTNDADVYCLGDTMVVGTYTNNGTTTVQVGTLTIVGTLINNGTIIGDVVGGFREGGSTAPGDGLAIAGNYVAGADAALLLADPLWAMTVGGHYDVAIDDHLRYHMAEAQLRMAGAGQSLELMSEDIGADRAGLDRTQPGHYPLGTLVIESGSTTTLVDLYDNSGGGRALCEAVYVGNLIIEAGATLNTFGCRVYYDTAKIDGMVDNPAYVIALPPPCPWDCDGSGDGQVSVTDFLAILAQWGQVGAPCDFDDDGVGVVDFLALLGHWGPCP